MEQDLYSAFALLGVGMLTVALVLTLVVLAGSLLIRILNLLQSRTEHSVDESHVAAIVATVEVVTGGKGKITQIEKAD